MADKQVNTAASDAISEAVTGEMLGKKWYLSKTFWTNVLAGLAFAAQAKYGYVFDVSVQALSLAGINLLLRKITKEPVVW